jgi:hypothetical protein
MSKQTALEFIHRVNDDAGLRTADWNAAVAEMASDTSRALSNAELANVAGGLSTQTSGGAFDWGDSFLSRRMGKFLGD